MPSSGPSTLETPHRHTGGDRRVLRTRAALTAAFADLALERRYEDIGINDVTERAAVGRSTLYVHFSGKEDLLAHSLDRHLRTIARCTLRPEMQPDLVPVIEHFWQQRKTARAILDGEPAVAITRLLACHLEASLFALGANRGLLPAFPASMISMQLASGQVALLSTWLAGRGSAHPEAVAKLLHGTTCAAGLAAIQQWVALR